MAVMAARTGSVSASGVGLARLPLGWVGNDEMMVF